jgi:hypothetical protein
MKRTVFALSAAALVALAAASPAHAGDALQASVTPLTGPSPIVTANGNPASPGTFAVGTIQVDYTHTGFAFPAGTFATFRLDLATIRLSDRGQFPNYPVDVALDSLGSPNVQLVPAATSIAAGAPPWSGSTDVEVVIPDAVASDPALSLDGTTIVGNLRLAAPGSHLDTTTNVQVRIRLVHPDACLKLYDFITDTTLATAISTTTVNLGGPPSNRRVVSTSPGQFSNNALVVNTCPTPDAIDLAIDLDPRFSTNPSSPGQAVFVYTTAGSVLPGPLDLASFGAGTPSGQTLAFSSLAIPASSSVLVTVKMGIITGVSVAELGASPFSFSATAYEAGSAFGILRTDVGPTNPAVATLDFTLP